MSMLYRTCKHTICTNQKRTLFYWIDKTFNQVDDERLKQFGADRTCAEWILRNGGKIKFVGGDSFEGDYNNLPKEEVHFNIQEVDASKSSIMGIGFEHLKGCKFISKIILDECNYLENDALKELQHVKDSLLFLQVSRCLNISDIGLLNLVSLHKLRNLIIFGLPYVKDKAGTLSKLQTELKQCNIKFE